MDQTMRRCLVKRKVTDFNALQSHLYNVGDLRDLVTKKSIREKCQFY